MKNKIWAALVGTFLMQSFSVPVHAQALEQFAGNQKIAGNHPGQVSSHDLPLELRIIGSRPGDASEHQTTGVHNINLRLTTARQVNYWPSKDSGRRAADLLVSNAKTPDTISTITNHSTSARITSAAPVSATGTNLARPVPISNFPGSNLYQLQKLPSNMGAMIGCGFRISANDAPYISEYANQITQGSKPVAVGALVHRN